MQRGSFLGTCAGLALVFGASMFAEGQEPPGGRGGAQPIPQFNRTPPVDAAAHERGRSLWASHCVDCHGAQARGTEKGPNIIRTKTVNFDRSSPQAGSVLGPFLKAGHPTQSGKPASFTNDEVIALATFLRQRVTDTMRWSTLFVPGNILVGDSRAGEAYFNGEGGCSTCHNATTRSLQGIASRLDTPVDLQQRMLFPGPGRGGRGVGAAGGNTSNRTTVTITPPSGPAVSGVLVEESEFYITLRDADGTIRAVRRTPGMRVAKNNPLQAHIDLLDRITDKQIHDLVAYLETLK
jgi:cytochrome c oxidase cbb3-type subunit III